MNWTAAPRKPTLYSNDTEEARWARRLLERYAIDFAECRTADRFVSLRWNGTTYTDVFEIVDFLMFAGRLALSGTGTRDRGGDGEQPGARIRLT